MTTLPTALPARRAILLSISAILCFSIMDACVKAITPLTGTYLALWARYAGQMVMVTIIFAPQLRSIARSGYPRLQVLRSVMLMLATFFFFLGLGRIGLAQATAVMSLNPLFITLGGALFLGERIGPRRVFAIVAALVGAMLVIQPGSAAFQPAALFPLAAAICFSTYALVTRRVGPDEDVRTSLFYTGLVGGVLLTGGLPWGWETPSGPALALMLAIMIFGTLGQFLLIRALSAAEAGLLAPFNYTGLVFATLIGLVVFSEVPDRMTILGALVIVGAGVYVWLRETQSRPGKSGAPSTP